MITRLEVDGIYPAKMIQMVRLLQDLAVDASKAPGLDNPFRQVIVATHSPVFVQLQDKDDLLFALDTINKITCSYDNNILPASSIDPKIVRCISQ